MKEPTLESLTKKKREYEPARFMSVNVASQQILNIVAKRKERDEHESELGTQSECVGVARVGAPDQRVVVCPLVDMPAKDLGPPLHSLVIPAPNLHPLESEYLAQFK